MNLRALEVTATRSLWTDHGLSRWTVEHAIADGVLVRLGNGAVVGVEAVDDAVLAHAAAVRAAQLRMRGIAVASHGSAAYLLGLSRLGRFSGRVRLTRGGGRYRRLDEEARLHVAGLPPDHVTVAHGVPVTTPARTVADLARMVSFRSGVVLADSALRLGERRDEMERVLDFCRRWPGRRRALLVMEFANPLAETPLESVSRVALREFGVPQPELQSVLDVGMIVRVDFRWDRVVGEADGLLKYADASALRREKLREMALQDAGFEVVRWTWDEIWRTPEVVVRRLRRAFARTGQRF